MERWNGLEQVPSGWGRCVVTIGVFDGLHRGHQTIVARAVEQARADGLPSVLMTFVPHPSEVVRPGTHPPMLTTLPRRSELVEGLGVDVFCALPFTLELSRMAPGEFAHEALVSRLHASHVVVGENFRFGHKAAGDVATLAELGRSFGFRATGVPLLAEDTTGAVQADTPISSTYVRACVGAGDMAAATHALGRPHRLDGVVERGDQRGRKLGFPTANMRLEPYAAVPADGVYAGRVVRLDRFGHTLPHSTLGTTAISVGTNPTFQGRERRVEAHILDFDGDLYGDQLGVEFTHRLRGMERYDTLDELVDQMTLDCDAARRLVAAL